MNGGWAGEQREGKVRMKREKAEKKGRRKGM